MISSIDKQYAGNNIDGVDFAGPAQAQNLRDSLVEAKSDIVVKVRPSFAFFQYSISCPDAFEKCDEDENYMPRDEDDTE
jgi:hypothetical protein